MYIVSFVGGILTTLFIEMALLIIVAFKNMEGK